ncbi:hypothetical protein [Actinoallomurus soli]|uniref:hypothetical protein n=1 Tax=Actinoallomurus soli TaxID=2952535 RepID=UPI002093FE29|nr:hypothetical protein [Actinoallomurus soli]MCO5972043.1 hypothetical protein [Actinoallomurus soli]
MNQATEVLEPDPVFVDPTGRRARIMRRTGIALGCLIAGYLVLVAVGMATGARVPLTPWPQTRHSASGHGHAGQLLMPRGGADGSLPSGGPTGHRSPSGPAQTGRASGSPKAGAAPTTGTSPAPGSATPTAGTTTSAPALPTATPTTRGKGKGKGVGLTKSPHPRHT